MHPTANSAASSARLGKEKKAAGADSSDLRPIWLTRWTIFATFPGADGRSAEFLPTAVRGRFNRLATLCYVRIVTIAELDRSFSERTGALDIPQRLFVYYTIRLRLIIRRSVKP